MRYLAFISIFFAGIFGQIQSKEFSLYVFNNSGKPLDMELFGIKHTMPLGSKRKFISDACWGDIKQPGLAALIAPTNYTSHAYAWVNGKKQSLIKRDKTCDRTMYTVVQKYVHTGKDAMKMLREKKIYDADFEPYKIEGNQIKFHNPLTVILGGKKVVYE